MAIKELSSRAVIGRLFYELNQPDDSWVAALAGDVIPSNQASETYAGLANVAPLREWVGPRAPRTLREVKYVLANKSYEDTLDVTKEEIRRDKTVQVDKRISDLAGRYREHWLELCVAAIQTNGNGWDNVAFFSASHADTDVGAAAQSNAITKNIGASENASDPSAGAMHNAILAGVIQILGLKDNFGKPMNRGKRAFHVLVPLNLLTAAVAAIKNQLIAGSVAGTAAVNSTISAMAGYTFTVDSDPLLTTGASFYVFVRDGRSFIRQEEVALDITAKAEGSDYEHDTGHWQFGIETVRAFGYGNWQSACKVTMNAA